MAINTFKTISLFEEKEIHFVVIPFTCMPNGISHPYQVDQSISVFYSNLNRIFCEQKVVILIRRRVLHCLPMSHKKDARLEWDKLNIIYCDNNQCSFIFCVKLQSTRLTSLKPLIARCPSTLRAVAMK